MSLKNNIMSILKDIDSMDDNKYRVLETAIKDRLSKSLSTYNSTISFSLDYLQRKEAIKVMRRVNKS